MIRDCYSREDLYDACCAILGSDVVVAMGEANIGMTRIHDMAMKSAFVKKIDNEYTGVLRNAAIDLEELGMYEYN